MWRLEITHRYWLEMSWSCWKSHVLLRSLDEFRCYGERKTKYFLQANLFSKFPKWSKKFDWNYRMWVDTLAPRICASFVFFVNEWKNLVNFSGFTHFIIWLHSRNLFIAKWVNNYQEVFFWIRNIFQHNWMNIWLELVILINAWSELSQTTRN